MPWTGTLPQMHWPLSLKKNKKSIHVQAIERALKGSKEAENVEEMRRSPWISLALGSGKPPRTVIKSRDPARPEA